MPTHPFVSLACLERSIHSHSHKMATLTSFPSASPLPSILLRRCHPHALSPSPMIPVLRHRRLLTSLASAVLRDPTTSWTQTPLTRISPASADPSLFHVALDVSDSPDLAAAFTSPGQYVQLRVPTADGRPSFLAIASPPSLAASEGRFEFLVKKVAGSTAGALCGLHRGDVVEVAGVMGKGFDVARISPPDLYQTVLIFATGSGISPIRSLIESGFNANQRSDVRLYYGARNLQRMAYQDRFKHWEATGVKILPVLSQPDDSWKGERGYVQAVFSKAKQILKSSSTGAVLCGHKQMAEDVTSVLVADGVSQDKILKNF
ncbi:putative fruit protein [Iris pallida]|uniref:Fruit protein n=1 Tax=Iris pallida TaxID=29817 RepID=A0AAX6IJK7_IRIPA|nr:putative fruit protein [Iris pallida]KAJ6853439.1 putative fruit protein [Iris pallida]